MKKLTLLLMSLFVTLISFAGEVTETEALQKAQQFMQGKQFKQRNLRRAPSTAGGAYYVFNVENKGGFVIVAGEDRMPDILGYSEKGNFDLTKAPDNVKWLMGYYAKIAKSLKDNNDKGGSRRVPATRAEVQPLIKTTWDQMSPYCNHCPTIQEGYLTPTGCVATAMAQVINFLQWPLEEVKAVAGYTTSTTKTKIDALPAMKFNWYNMTDDDIAWLMRYCGQSVLMDYGISESGAAPSNIPNALISVFGYSKSTKLEMRSSYVEDNWEELIYNEVNLGRPVIYSGFQKEGSGHSFVVHGYRDGKFYVNWGWSGDCDGYFALTNLAPNEYMNFSDDQNAVIGIQPASADANTTNEVGSRTIDVTQAGTLSNYISETEKFTINKLTLTGKLNSDDIRFIREMAGSDVNGQKTEGLLKELDLSNAQIVEGGEPYYSMYSNSKDAIGEFMFAYCFKLSKISLPNTVKSIEAGAFDTSGLTAITIPKSVTKIDPRGLGTHSWLSWTFLASIQVEEGNPVYRSENNAIYERKSGKLVRGCASTIIPEGVTTIGEYAFYQEFLMKEIKLPESLTTIEDYAFQLTGLSTLTIPKNVTKIGYGTFWQCEVLSSISVDEDNPIYDSRNNCNAIIETATNTLIQGSSTTDIPEGIVAIGDYAFSFIGLLTSIKLPQSLVSIGTEAFSGTEIMTVDIPIKVKYIGPGSFQGLNTIKVHYENPIEIDENTFYTPSTILVVPDGTKERYKAAKGWNKLDKIVENSFAHTRTINVSPAGSLPTLLSADEKKCVEELILTGELNGTDFKYIRDMAFSDYPTESGSLKKLDLSNARIVEGGEPNASQADVLETELYNCKTIEQIVLPKNLTKIGFAAFQGTSINSIVIPKSVLSIDKGLFWNDSYLSSISVEEGNPVYDSRDNCNAIIETATNKLIYGCKTTIIPESVTAIGDNAFEQNNFSSIVIPDGIKSIGHEAFIDNINLKSVVIPKNVEHIGISAFEGCIGIKSIVVSPDNPKYDSRDNCNAIIETATNTLIQGCATTTIPNDVTSIGQYAFLGHINLSSIEIPSSITEIQQWAFLNCDQLSKVVCHIKKPLMITMLVFKTANIREAALYVPYGTKALYASTPGWDVFGNIVEMEPDGSYQSNSASIAVPDFGKHYAARNGKVEVPITITGEGIEPITSIDYTITTGSETKEYHLEIPPISYMMTSEVLIPFDADDMASEEEKTLKITKVNGVANECTENTSASGTLVTVAKKPKIIPVVEEYTGTWCGWCVKGIVGLNLLNKTFKNDVITIAIHDGIDDEPMILPEYRSVSGTYPSCHINRGKLMDPYYGTNNQAFGIKKEVEAAQRDYALGGIDVEAEWTDESHTAINIKTTTTFVEDIAESPYQIGYVLLEDGLTGTGNAWAQSNYYAGSSTSDENLKELTNKPFKITDMKYDHVPVAAWEPMTGVAGTIPTTITHDVPMEYTFKADISGNTRIQNKNKLTVVVLLIDKETGKIINANKVSMAKGLNIDFTEGQQWHTFYSEKSCKPLEGKHAMVYAVTSIDDHAVYVEEITGGIPANKMVLIGLDSKPTEPTTVYFEYGDASYNGTNLLHGNDAETTNLAPYSTYVLYNDEFVRNSGTSVAAGKGYLLADDMKQANSARSLDIVIGDGTTIIREAINDEYFKDVWFDLQGRRYNGKPSKKGVFIINNKKVVVK